jgi:glycerol-3-phosphate acyltransferase PlsY
MFQIVIILLTGYLFGSIPNAIWYARTFHNIDIREHGSGNAGATNSLRIIGKKAGIIVLVLDTLKGLFPVLIALYFGLSEILILTTGFLAIVGHIWPVFANFKGGKGVATSLGVILGVSTIGAGFSLLFFIGVVLATGYVSLASLIAAFVFVIYYFVKNPDNQLLSFSSLAIFLLLVFTHRENISRLKKGTENKFSRKK